MKRKNNAVTRGIAIVLGLALVGTLGYAGLTNVNTASAVTSLPHITNIVGTQEIFNILEIVPENGSGSLGYYAAGQEPFKDWQTVLATKLNPGDRETYANSVVEGLEASGLLGRDATTPLAYSGSSSAYTYDEKYYWQMSPSEFSTWTKLTLNVKEIVTLDGTFSPNAGGTGRYKGVYNYIYYGAGKDYVQDVDRFVFEGTGVYYYNPIFSAITSENLEELMSLGKAAYIDACALYGKVNANGTIYVSEEFPEQSRDADEVYYLKGAYGPGYEKIAPTTDFTTLVDEQVYTATGTKEYYADIDDAISLSVGTDYYYVSDAGEPMTTMDSGNRYAAVSSGYIKTPGSGWFDREITGYSYMPDGGGDADYDANTTSTVTYPVETDTVYYQGTVSNNDWFLKYVFDIAEPSTSAISVSVQSVTPSQLTADMVSAANLISLSGGFVPSTPGATRVTDYNTTNDLTQALAYTIYAATTTGKCPMIVDYPLTTLSGDLNLTRLARLSLLYTNTTVSQADFAAYDMASWSALASENFVSGNIYCFNSPFDSGADTILSVATPHFKTAFSEAVADSTAFAAVLTEINRENFLREVDHPGTTDLLAEQVTVANTLRYIINYAGQRVTTIKASIKVLDLEPGNATTGALSKTTLLGWLGTGSGYDADDISITTMSTAEFIGKIEDINETYDLVYIGTSLDGFNTTTSGSVTTTNYNDNTMDGLIYSNIGDTYYSSKGTDFYGLLARDSDTTLRKLYRFSGNDITAAKAQELLYFAQGGYPVIMANDVFLPTESAATPFTVTVTPTVNGTNVTLSASAVDSTSGTAMNATYRWYKSGSTTIQSTNTIYTFSAVSGTSNYYCVATSAANSVSNATSNTIIVNRSADVSATVDTSSARDPGSYGDTVDFDVALAYSRVSDILNGDTVTITATAVDSSGAVLTGGSPVYQWYYFGNPISGQTNNSLTITASSTLTRRYYCRITLNGSSDYALSTRFRLLVSNDGRYDISEVPDTAVEGSYIRNTVNFNANVTASASGTTANLAASPVDAATGAVLSGTFTYNWYYGSGTSAGNQSTCAVTLPTDVTSRIYYCRITPSSSSDYASSYNILVSKAGVTATDSTTGSVVGSYHPTVYASSGAVNSARVDDSSYVYQTITSIKDRANVMTVSEIDAPTLLNYLKLSKPEIVFASAADYPTEYSITGGTMTAMAAVDGVYYLNYRFTIQNATDPTPATTRYDCHLYLDLNADGRYAELEMLDDITVKAGSTVIFPTLNSDNEEYYELSAGVTYTVTREVPTQYVGILPWQLEIVKNGAERVHASKHNYTRIAPASKEQIDILQINSDSSPLLDLHAQQEPSTEDYAMPAANNKSYTGIYGKLLADVADFEVHITTVGASTLEALNFTDTIAPSTGTDRQKIFGYLDNFDMIIIGFDDTFSTVQADTAAAITDFIDSGKSTLFTHDTTSFHNTSTGSWGYYFNTVIRGKVGLDRYGITSTDTVTVNGTTSMIKSLLYPGTALSPAQQAAIKAAGYSIANDANTSTTVPEVQGFSSYELIRYRDTSSQLSYTTAKYATDGNIDTTRLVSQVNEGQITTYPYDINTAAFNDIPTDGSDRDMAVGLTHEQYYQLNMNSEDIVVWYCLSSGGSTTNYFNDLPNDVMNAYYIFNKGNVTYSGVGHNSGSEAGLYVKTYEGDNIPTAIENEAKLFINTMIAAYQSGNQAPEIKIVDSVAGNVDANFHYFLSDFNTESTAETQVLAPSSSERAVYFEIADTNLNVEKQISVQFFYNDGVTDANNDGTIDTNIFTPVKVNEADTNYIYKANGAAAATIQGGKVYIMYLPDDVLDALGNDLVSDLTITIEVTTTMGTAAPLVGRDTISLRKIELFPLK